MADDIRVKTSLRTNPKWVRLGARLGEGAQLCLIYLWLWTREHRSKGVLHDIQAEEIEAVVGWSGEAGALIAAFLDLRLLDDDGGTLVVHQWDEHEPWAVNAEHRSRVGRENAKKGWESRRGGQGKHKKAADANGKRVARDPQANGKRSAMLPPTPLSPHSTLKEGGSGTASAALPDGEGAAMPTCASCQQQVLAVTPDDGRCLACTARISEPHKEGAAS